MLNINFCFYIFDVDESIIIKLVANKFKHKDSKNNEVKLTQKKTGGRKRFGIGSIA